MLWALVVGALAQLADQVASQLPSHGALSLSVHGPGRLGSEGEALLKGRLRERGRVVDPPPGAADYRVDCTAAVPSADKTSLDCTVLAISGELWRGLTGTLAGDAVGRVFALAPLDDDVRHLAVSSDPPRPPARAGSFTPRTIPLGDVEIVALAIGDALGDGHPALVALTDRDIVIYRLAGDRV